MADEPVIEPRRVVYDVNIFLRVAEQLRLASWDYLEGAPPPIRGSAEQQAISIAIERTFAGPIALELWISRHITDLVIAKLIDTAQDNGLGWEEGDALNFTQRVLDLVYDTGGEEIDVTNPLHAPPLDHEDGLVLATAQSVSATYLVTNDIEFRAHVGDKYYDFHLMSATEWVRWVSTWRQRARRSAS